MARLYPGALVWCIKQPGSKLRQEVQDLLAWQRVKKEIDEGTLGGDLKPAEIEDVHQSVVDERKEAEAEVWASYRYLALFDPTEPGGIREIDLGSGHAAAGETLSGRVIAALKSNSLLNESVGAGYIDRNWPPALLKPGAWPLSSLRQAFVSGALTRLIDPDATIRSKVVEFVERGDFGLAANPQPDGSYDYVWFREPLPVEEISFDAGVFLLRKDKAQALKTPPLPPLSPVPGPTPPPLPPPPPPPLPDSTTRTLRISGNVPADSWNRVGTRLIPKLRGGEELQIRVQFSATVSAANAAGLGLELRQILEELGLAGTMQVSEE